MISVIVGVTREGTVGVQWEEGKEKLVGGERL